MQKISSAPSAQNFPCLCFLTKNFVSVRVAHINRGFKYAISKCFPGLQHLNKFFFFSVPALAVTAPQFLQFLSLCKVWDVRQLWAPTKKKFVQVLQTWKTFRYCIFKAPIDVRNTNWHKIFCQKTKTWEVLGWGCGWYFLHIQQNKNDKAPKRH